MQKSILASSKVSYILQIDADIYIQHFCVSIIESGTPLSLLISLRISLPAYKTPKIPNDDFQGRRIGRPHLVE